MPMMEKIFRFNIHKKSLLKCLFSDLTSLIIKGGCFSGNMSGLIFASAKYVLSLKV